MKRMPFLLFTLLFFYSCSGGRYNYEGPEFIEISGAIPQNTQWRENVTFFDLDNDGLKDMITPSPRPYRTSPRVFLNRKEYWLEITQQCVFPTEVDFYGWVKADSSGNLYFAVHGRGVFALKKTGFCSWENASDGLPPAGEFPSRALAIGDINHDGLTDIAAISDNFYAHPKTIRAFLGDGSFGWTEASNGLPQMVSGDRIHLSDINGDGLIDIIVDNTNQSSNSIIWFGDGDGNWVDGSANLPKGSYYATTPIKGGFLSMLSSNTSNGGPFLFVLEDGSWKLVKDTGLPDSRQISALAVADINGDGIDDVILGDNSSMTLRIFSGQGGYKFKEALSLFLPKDHGFIWNIAVTDLNNDNKPDIVVNMTSSDDLGAIRVFVQK